MRHHQYRQQPEQRAGNSISSPTDRAEDIVRAAFSVVAECGFEGLRVREVAIKSGLNVATLHYYFPSKNDLILGISKYLAKQFVTVRAPAVPQTEHSVLGWLRQGFDDAEFYARSRPDLAVVTQELALRARRDRFVNEVMDKLIRDWRRAVRKMLKLGIADGVFRCDIDLTAMVNLLAAVFSGVSYLKPHEIAGVGASVEVLLIGKPL